jgi:putative pyruvate formate lyase activating enzyme
MKKNIDPECNAFMHCTPKQQSSFFHCNDAAHKNSALQYFKNCTLCPRNCSVDRTQSKSGYCGESDQLRIATIESHFGEEPPISGTNGSGTVFFTECSLKCITCQNYQISHQKLGNMTSVAAVVDKIIQLFNDHHIHNVNFVTPDHFFPYTIQIVNELRMQGIELPIVYNLSGFQKVDSLHKIESAADIYLPDFKYSDPGLAKNLSNCENYPDIALSAISEMVRQKGFLDSFINEKDRQDALATKGVLVRHLILPGQVGNSINALTTLFLEFGSELPISLMSQYYPIHAFSFDFLNRTITLEEFNAVHQFAMELGFKNMFVQYPEAESSIRPFLPDFDKEKPFAGNIKKIY